MGVTPCPMRLKFHAVPEHRAAVGVQVRGATGGGHHAEGGDERRDPEDRHQAADDGADQRAHRQRRQHGHEDRQGRQVPEEGAGARGLGQGRGDDGREGGRGADRQINALGDDRRHHAETDDADGSHLHDDVEKVLQLQEPALRDDAEQDHESEQDEDDRILLQELPEIEARTSCGCGFRHWGFLRSRRPRRRRLPGA